MIKDDCQADLDEAMPAYKASIRALDSLDKKSIQEMKVRHPGWHRVTGCDCRRRLCRGSYDVMRATCRC